MHRQHYERVSVSETQEKFSKAGERGGGDDLKGTSRVGRIVKSFIYQIRKLDLHSITNEK